MIVQERDFLQLVIDFAFLNMRQPCLVVLQFMSKDYSSGHSIAAQISHSSSFNVFANVSMQELKRFRSINFLDSHMKYRSTHGFLLTPSNHDKDKLEN